MRRIVRMLGSTTVALLAAGCSNGEGNRASSSMAPRTGAMEAGTKPPTNRRATPAMDGGSTPPSGGNPEPSAEAGAREPMDGGASPATGGGPGTVGQTNAVFPKANALPKLTNLVGTVREDSVAVDFDPVDGAADYRIFPLPKGDDVTVDASGLVVVRDATYRCAGMRQGWDATNNLNAGDSTLAVPQGQYSWKTDIPAEPTLGYVFVTPATDRTPVYALAGHISPPEYGWRETRLKIYTTDPNERKSLLDQNWRDDGIVFYVPRAGSGTRNVYGSQVSSNGHYEQYYFSEKDVTAHAKDTVPPTTAFPVLTAAATETVPLMAVTYKAGATHTELSPGKERFRRAAYQGNSPLWHVEWSGITEPVTLVVEALSSGCPYQGFLSATHLDPSAASGSAPHQAFSTLDELRRASATGEVFINGEYDERKNPTAIARSFIKVGPLPHRAADWDWYQGFAVGTDLGTLNEQKTLPSCWKCLHWQTPLFDVTAYNIDDPNGIYAFTFGTLQGQLWVNFDDWLQGVTGKVRFTATEKATIDEDASKYLHVAMSVDIVSTDRRYPQLIISDQDAPVQEGFSNPDNDSLIVQSINGPAARIELQAIHGLFGPNGKAAPWDVNNQAPSHAFLDFDSYDDSAGRPPTNPAFEYSGVDRLTRFDVYASSSRLYLLLDGAPAGCSKYPSNVALKGPVTVTFGAVLYHEGATDELVWSQPKPYGFWHQHEATETKRHFDDLAFKNGVAAPAWDEKKFPCGDY